MTDQQPAPIKYKGGNKLLATLLIFFIGLFVGRYVVPMSGAKLPLTFTSEINGQRQLVFPTFWEAWDELHIKFNGELDDKKLFYGAVAGMVQAAGDPYTSFFDPDTAKKLEETLQGSFSGVGIEIGLKNGLVTVIAPLDGTPAKKAGIQEGDIIVAIDKHPLTQDMTVDAVVNKIRGTIGTPVTLTVISREEKSTKDITIVRDTIVVQSVKTQIQDNLGIITLTSFNSDTAARFTEAARTLSKAKVKGVVLDMRGNPGGYLTAAVDISSHFIEPGQVVVSEKGKQTKEYKARGIGLFRNIPVVVLVDGGSASASEIVAGALKDVRHVPIIGTKTFGKGSVQELSPLADGSSIKVTVAKWYTPNGSSINEHGIDSTVSVERSKDQNNDTQLDRAKQELLKLINP